MLAIRLFPFLALVFSLLIGHSAAFSQHDWQITPKSPQVFIENLGQYDALSTGFSDEGKFVMDHGFGWQVLVGEKGIHYLIQRRDLKEESAQEEHAEEFPNGEVRSSRISMEFVGISPQAELRSIGQQDDYYTYSYPVGDEFVNVDRANAYEKLRYAGIYTGIDAEFVGQGDRGLKYSFHLQAGADPAQIRLRWKGATPSLDAVGQIHLPAVLGELVDQAPKAWYADDASVYIPVEFKLIGNEVTFELGPYDHQRAIVIDPWTINPALPAPFNRAYEVDNDAAGNVYVFGGGMGYNLKKYNAAGTLQWTHVSPWDTSNGWFGELLTLGAGDCFITSGSAAKMRRLTTAGATTFTNNGPFFNLDEYWTMILSCDNTKLVTAGTRIISLTSPQGHVFNINMANGNQIAGSPYNVSPVGMKEIRALCTGGNGNYYMLSNDNLIAVNQAFGIIYSIATGTSHPYNAPAFKAVNVQGQNSIDANTTHVFINTGANLQKRDIATGALVSQVAITGGGFSGGFFGSGSTNAGMVVDACNNLYVGSTNAIYKYDANLTLLGSVATTGAIYDLKIPSAGTLIAGGNALVISNTTLSPCAPKPISCVILPATLSHLEGECEGGKMKLNWVTEKEIEMSHFEVERALDGSNWVNIFKANAIGNSESLQNYNYEEAVPSNLSNGHAYYRLKMVDRNGEFQYSGIAMVAACGEWDQTAKVSPTVTEGAAELEFSAAAEGNGTLKVLNLEGRVVHSQKITWEAGINHSSLALRDLVNGTYLITVEDGKGKFLVRNARVVKQ
jgi:hypothetical protein